MQINGVGALGGARLRFAPQAQSLALPATARPSASPAMRDFARKVVTLKDRLSELRLEGRLGTRAGSPRPAYVQSSALGLGDVGSPTTLRSTEEVNTVPTSYSTHEGVFAGNSSAVADVQGVYDGTQGDDTLTFEVTKGGVVGTSSIKIEVRDSSGGLVQRINVNRSLPGTVFTLDNGLEFSLSAGYLQNNETFDLDVWATVGTDVDVDDQFNGTGDGVPEFDPGLSVGPGSFDVNGVSINVFGNDTIQTVLDRITNSAAGVTATFDADAEQVLLSQQTPGPGATIVVDNDTSGFLAATKLAGATPVLGTEGDDEDEPIQNVAALAGIQTGTFSINGTQFNVDVAVDSLQDVVAMINAANVGASAVYDPEDSQVLLRGTGGGPLELVDESSNLFAGLGIDEGLYKGRPGAGRAGFQSQNALRDTLVEFVDAFREVFEVDLSGFGAATADGVRRRLETAVASAFSDHAGESGTGTLRSGLGLDLVKGRGEFRGLQLDEGELRNALRRSPRSLERLFFAAADDADPGLVARFEKILGEAGTQLETLLGPEASAGLRLDLLA